MGLINTLVKISKDGWTVKVFPDQYGSIIVWAFLPLPINELWSGNSFFIPDSGFFRIASATRSYKALEGGFPCRSIFENRLTA